MRSSLSRQKQHSIRKSRGLQVVSNTKPSVPDQSISYPSVKQSKLQYSHDNKETKENFQTQELQRIDRNYSFIIDYQNARYHGKTVSSDQTTRKFIKNGPGILVDDDMNLIFTHWKNNLPDSKTVIINRFGNYFYSKVKASLRNPFGTAIVRVGTVIFLTKFSQKTGLWNMTQNDKDNIMIAIDEKTLSLVVLKGKVQSVAGQFKCLKSCPLSVVQFVHFPVQFSGKLAKKQSHQHKSPSSHQSKTTPNTQKPQIQQILLTYAQKYGFEIENQEVSISHFLSSIAHSIMKECLCSKQFSYKVTKNLLNKVFSHQNNDKKPNKQNYESYEKQKQQIYDKNFIVFTECKSNSSKVKETSFYFGFKNGLGIKFKNQHSNQDKMDELKTLKSFKPMSIGIHNEKIKIEDIGARFYDNNCIEEGNFKTKNTFTYENPVFRPTNKLTSIYNKYHKQQTTFLNEYFEKGELPVFKLLENFQTFLNEHVIYILNQCLIETTKFNEKSQRNELVEKVLLKTYKKSKHVPNMILQSNIHFRGPSYEVKVERKEKIKDFFYDRNNALNELKDKKSELKEKIKKVKYQIQYLPEDDNVVVMTDQKFMSKIKKHLMTDRRQKQNKKNNVSRNQGKSQSDRSRSKSVVVSRSKSRTTYIQKEKPKLKSPKKNKRNSPTKKGPDDQIHQSSASKVRPKTQAELILGRINHSIEYKQKFNSGIEFNVENDYARKKSRRNQSPNKNRYNGRNRFFTDNELDSAVDHHLSSSSQVSVKTITPGKKNKKKEQLRHMIYSNTKRNHNNEEQKYEQQKQTEQSIRAQILGVSLQEYRRRIEFQQQKNAYMQQNFLKLIEEEQSLLKSSIRKIPQQFQEYPDPNETFGAVGNESIQYFKSNPHRKSSQNQGKEISFLESQPKNGPAQMKNTIYEETFYCPKPKQQSLIEKRLRILQDYRELNSKHVEKEDSAYVPLYNNNLKSKNTQSPSFREYSPLDFKRQKHYEKLPVYKEKCKKKVLSPLKSMIQNRDSCEIIPYGKSSYIAQEESKGKTYEKDQRIIGKFETMYKKSRTNEDNQQLFSAQVTSKNLTRKYQYYFD